MDKAQQLEIENWYHAYVRHFYDGGSLPPMQAVKHEHSLRVAREAGDLAVAMGWPAEEVRTAGILGLLHDIGRFSQFAEFGTLMDAKSVNHAQRGVEVLECEGPLTRLPETERAWILEGVRQHNCKAIAPGQDEKTLRFIKLIRDADKLDIFLVLHDAVVTGKVREHPELLLGGTLEGKANPRLVDSVRHGKMASPAEIKCLADLCLFQLGWVYDINFKATMRSIRDRNVLENIRGHLPPDDDVRAAAEAALAYRDETLAAD